MKRFGGMLVCTALAMGCITGCGSSTPKKDVIATDTSKVTTETNEINNTDSEAMTQIKIWHDGDEKIMQVIANSANEKLGEDKIKVVFEKKTGLTDQLKLYGTDQVNGPDMYLYAHDSLGIFAEMGILEPITNIISEDEMADLIPMTVEAGQYKDTQYLVPVYYETLLFMYNKAKWEGEIPETTDALYDYMVAHTDTTAGEYALVNQHSTAYNVAPIINGFNACIIDQDANPGLNSKEMKEAINYNKKFAQLQADGDYNTITTLFNEGKAAAIIGGPWLISGINDAGIDLGIKSLADFKLPNGNSLAPYSGVQSIGVLKCAVGNKKDAIAKVLEAIASPEVGINLANESNCAPAHIKAYEDSSVAANEMIMAMKATAETAQPMPNIPQMSVMWQPTETMLAAVNKSGEDVEKVANQYQEEAITAIKDMQ